MLLNERISMRHPKVLAMIMAGGQGKRLFPLTFERSKPSVPFGGRYRIVDFVLSNFINSGIFSIYLLVQYKSQSLIDYVRQNWMLSAIMPDHFVTVVPPQMRYGPEWFQGTADSVFQNMNLLRQHRPALVAVFGADHIYRMDMRQMIDFHLQSRADVTIAARPVPISDACTFGVINTHADGTIRGFQEKPDDPIPIPSRPDKALVSMGNYIFNADVLKESLIEAQRKAEHDFGSYVMPNLLKNGMRLLAYDFTTNQIPGVQYYEEQGYWRDVGTIKAFWEAHQDMLGEEPLFQIHNDLWPIRPPRNDLPAAKIISGDISNSVIAEGVTIKNARIHNSFIRRGAVIEDGVEVRDSIIMDHVVLGKGASINRAIVDSYNIVEEGVAIGEGSKKPYWRAYSDPSGIAVIASEKRTSEL